MAIWFLLTTFFFSVQYTTSCVQRPKKSQTNVRTGIQQSMESLEPIIIPIKQTSILPGAQQYDLYVLPVSNARKALVNSGYALQWKVNGEGIHSCFYRGESHSQLNTFELVKGEFPKAIGESDVYLQYPVNSSELISGILFKKQKQNSARHEFDMHHRLLLGYLIWNHWEFLSQNGIFGPEGAERTYTEGQPRVEETEFKKLQIQENRTKEIQVNFQLIEQIKRRLTLYNEMYTPRHVANHQDTGEAIVVGSGPSNSMPCPEGSGIRSFQKQIQEEINVYVRPDR